MGRGPKARQSLIAVFWFRTPACFWQAVRASFWSHQSLVSQSVLWMHVPLATVVVTPVVVVTVVVTAVAVVVAPWVVVLQKWIPAVARNKLASDWHVKTNFRRTKKALYQVETIWFKKGSVSHGFTWLHMVSQYSSVSSGKTSLQHTARPTRSIMFFPSSCINTELPKNHPSFNFKNMEIMRNSPKVSNANLAGGWATPMKKMKVVWDCQGWTCNMFETTKQVIIGYTPIQSPLYPHAIPKKYSHSTPINYSH